MIMHYQYHVNDKSLMQIIFFVTVIYILMLARREWGSCKRQSNTNEVPITTFCLTVLT